MNRPSVATLRRMGPGERRHQPCLVRSAPLVLLVVGAMPLVMGWSIDSIVETGKVPDQPTSGVIPGGEYVAEGIAKNPTSVSIVLISPDKKISLYLADVTNGVYMKKIPIKADATLGNYYVVVLD